MLEKYDEFIAKKKSLVEKKKRLQKQIKDLDKQKIQLKIGELHKSMNKFVNGPSSY